MQNFALKFQAVAEKTAKMLGGYFILPHPVYIHCVQEKSNPPVYIVITLVNNVRF